MSEHEGARGGAPVGASLRAARVAAGLTLRELAEAVGVSVGTMSAVENDKVAVTVGRLQQLADVLGVPAVRLLTPTVEAVRPVPAGDDRPGAWRRFPDLDLDPVLEAAVEVFRETGYHGATMRMIASASGISVAGIYHYYRSKQSLLVALIDRVMDDLGWRVDAAGVGGAAEVRFHRMIEALALFHAVRGDLAFIVATETRSLAEPDRRRIADVRRAIQARLDGAAAEGVGTGAFGTRDAHRTARAAATMCMALPYWFSAAGAQTPASIAAEYADLAVLMMQGAPSAPGSFQPH